MKSILVTGATGFVGCRLIRRLAAQDLQLRVLVRNPDRLPASVRGRVEVVRGELGDAAATDRAVRGVDHVLHLAALATAYTRNPGDYNRLNTDAVEQLLAAAARHGVQRFVHVSSVVALPPVEPARVWGFGGRPTPYAVSKMAAEDVVRRHVAAGHDAVIVRPTRVYGPGPWNDANGTTRLVVLYLNGKLRVRLADREVEANYVHVDDVAAGIELAARRGRCGAAYMLGGENASLRRYLACASDVTGVHRIVIPVPPQLLLPVAHLATAWGRLGGNVSLTPEWLNNFLEHRPVDISVSRADLGYEPRSLHDGLRQTLAWVHRQKKGPWHVATKQFS